MFFKKYTPWYRILLEITCHVIITRYTVRGRGAKRRTSSVLPRIQHVTHVSLRRTCQEVPYQGGFGGSLFLLPCYKKSTKRVLKKSPRTGRYYSLTFLTAVYFWILENQEVKLSVDSSSEAALRSSRQKSIISRSRSRTTDLDVQHGWKERFAQKACGDASGECQQCRERL